MESLRASCIMHEASDFSGACGGVFAFLDQAGAARRAETRKI